MNSEKLFKSPQSEASSTYQKHLWNAHKPAPGNFMGIYVVSLQMHTKTIYRPALQINSRQNRIITYEFQRLIKLVFEQQKNC